MSLIGTRTGLLRAAISFGGVLIFGGAAQADGVSLVKARDAATGYVQRRMVRGPSGRVSRLHPSFKLREMRMGASKMKDEFVAFDVLGPDGKSRGDVMVVQYGYQAHPSPVGLFKKITSTTRNLTVDTSVYRGVFARGPWKARACIQKVADNSRDFLPGPRLAAFAPWWRQTRGNQLYSELQFGEGEKTQCVGVHFLRSGH
jgi:hypothetical protein